MKKLICILILAAMLLSCAACSAHDNAVNDTSADTTATSETTTAMQETTTAAPSENSTAKQQHTTANCGKCKIEFFHFFSCCFLFSERMR